MTIDLNKLQSGRKSPSGDFTLSPLFAEETGKAQQHQMFHLLTLELPSPEEPLHFVDSNYPVKFNGTEYTRFPFQITSASMTSDGSISKAALAVANVSREIIYNIERFNGLSNCKVLVKTVFANALDEIYTPQPDGSVVISSNLDRDATAYIEEEYVIDSYSATEQNVTFMLDPIIDLQIKLPRRRFMSDSCYWKYKDPQTCKYTGSITVDGVEMPCNKNFAACKLRDNEVNFGGFPGVFGSRRVYL